VEDDVDVWHYTILELHARNDDDGRHSTRLLQKTKRVQFVETECVYMYIYIYIY